MDRTILYVQASDEIAEALKCHFKDDELTFLVAKSGQEAFETLKSNDVFVVLADCYLPDMKLFEFVSVLLKEYPNIAVNVCIDVADPKIVEQVANMKGVKKIHLYPLDITEVEEELRATLDNAYIEQDFRDKVNALKEDSAQFEATLLVLKDALIKQRHSYYKLGNVMTPYLDTAISLRKEAAKKAGDTSDNEVLYEFTRMSAEKMLRLMTTSMISSEKIKEYVEQEIKKLLPAEGGIKLLGVESALSGNADKDKITKIVFSLWLLSYFESLRLSDGTIKVGSISSSSSSIRYTIEINGNENPKYNRKIENFANRITSCCTKNYEMEDMADGNRRYILDFEI